MSFPESLAAALFLIFVAVAALIAVARAGDRRWAERRRRLAEDTPSHGYINHDGTEGRWP